MKKITIFILSSFLLTGCGQSSGSDVFSFNSLYISLTDKFNPNNSANTVWLFNEGTSNINNLSHEEILFKSPIRPTIIKFGDLDSGLLGLTECLYSNNGDSSCTITISNLINPDVHPEEANAFRGVLKHEIGHAFGLGHIKTDPENNVMSPVFNDRQTLSQNVKQFVIDLTNFRKNGVASGLPSISTK
jgi:hypothetical protein